MNTRAPWYQFIFLIIIDGLSDLSTYPTIGLSPLKLHVGWRSTNGNFDYLWVVGYGILFPTLAVLFCQFELNAFHQDREQGKDVNCHHFSQLQ